MESSDPEGVADLRVIHESARVPRAFVLAGPRVSAEQRTKLADQLLLMSRDAAGSAVLERYNHVDGFDLIDANLKRQIAALETTYSLVRREMN